MCRKTSAAKRAVILVPDDDERDRWQAECLAACEAQGFEVKVLISRSDTSEAWADAMKVVNAGHAEIIVVATRDHVPPDRVPQLWIVAEQSTTTPRRRRPRRPRIMGR